VRSILLVIDRSASMAYGDALPRWDGIRDALPGALSTLDASTNLGLILFPLVLEDDRTSCELAASAGSVAVPLAPADTAVSAVIDAVSEGTVGGGSPTTAALEAALAYLADDGSSGVNEHPSVLLITEGGANCNLDLSCEASGCTVNLEGACPLDGDHCCDPSSSPVGGANCLDDTAAVAAIARLAERGIPTVVVGMPSLEAYASVLDAMAVAGGYASGLALPRRQYFDAGGPATATEIEATLRAAIDRLVVR
jgi:hypothetical protein